MKSALEISLQITDADIDALVGLEANDAFDERDLVSFNDLARDFVAPHWHMPAQFQTLSADEVAVREYDTTRQAGEHESVGLALQPLPAGAGLVDYMLLTYLPSPGLGAIAIFGASDFGVRELFLASRTGAVGFPVEPGSELDELIEYAVGLRSLTRNVPGFRRPMRPFLTQTLAYELLESLFDTDGIRTGRLTLQIHGAVPSLAVGPIVFYPRRQDFYIPFAAETRASLLMSA